MPRGRPEGGSVSRDLDALFDPRSIVVVGASADPAKWGNAVTVQALRGADRHAITLVNRRGGEVLGRPCVASVEELDGPVDLAVITVPESGLEEAVGLLTGIAGIEVVRFTAADVVRRDLVARIVQAYEGSATKTPTS